MRAWRGWIAVALLTALAFVGGPDAIDLTSPTAQGKVAAAETHDARAQDAQTQGTQVQDTQVQVAERRPHSHLRLSALLPAPQTAAPVPARGLIAEVPPVDTGVPDRAGHPHLGACTPEALQIFRC